jgi:hypothetical protein
MKFTQLKTYWTADDAHLNIAFLDELRDTLLATYGAEIIEQRPKETQQKIDQDDRQWPLDIDEDIDF